MTKNKPTEIFTNDIEETRQALEDWRSKRVGKERIPKSFWARAAELADRHGVWRIAKTLRLNYPRLKQLAGDAGSDLKPGPDFMELIGQAGGIGECVVEMENRRGSRMRIQVKGGVADLVGLSREFWSERV